jgi:hypothetical protein
VKAWQIAVVAVVVVAVGVGAFFGGRETAGSGTPTVEEAMKVLQGQFQQGGPGGNGAGFPGGNGAARGGNAVTGSIIASDSSSITVQTPDGSTKIVLVSSSTTVNKSSDGALSDLVAGQNVLVTGTTNTDGSVTATRIQVGSLPTAGGPLPGAGGPPPSGTGSPAPGAGGPPTSGN